MKGPMSTRWWINMLILGGFVGVLALARRAWEVWG